MPQKKKYRIYCVTEGENVSGFTVEDTPPTLCPHNPAHEVVADSKAVEERIAENNLEATTDPTATDDVTQGYVVGSRWLNITDDKEWFCANNTEEAAVWVLSAGDVFGENYAEQREDDEFSTNSEVYVATCTLSVTGLPGGKYRIGASYTNKVESKIQHMDVRLMLDDSTQLFEEEFMSPDSNYWKQSAFVKSVVLTSGDHHFDLEVRSSSSGVAVRIRDVFLEFWRVS